MTNSDAKFYRLVALVLALMLVGALFAFSALSHNLADARQDLIVQRAKNEKLEAQVAEAEASAAAQQEEITSLEARVQRMKNQLIIAYEGSETAYP